MESSGLEKKLTAHKIFKHDSSKIKTSVHFNAPKTSQPPRNPKYSKKSTCTRSKLDSYNIIKYPLTTESAMKKIEDNNTLILIVNPQANRHHIESSVKKLYNVDVDKISITSSSGEKKAYVRLTDEYDALDVANKIGII
ncbi:60S ribosomal protein L23a [Microplitis demolitor]|uniref:60S ribosomal protein L23a n=1 Tax=Microplitis demolitor TaxID=69319 RepID=UPI0004CD9AC3|nr:60S ribosomal protein L23a [Microplitis demolitor]